MKTIFMKKADWQEWDEALRAGAYQQGYGALCSVSLYCCLGVLQHCLTGLCEDAGLPSSAWLAEHKITFRDTAARGRPTDPYLESLGTTASQANDNTVDFITIADAIKEAVEFIDE